jgi:hypothetical protein
LAVVTIVYFETTATVQNHSNLPDVAIVAVEIEVESADHGRSAGDGRSLPSLRAARTLADLGKT